MRILIALAASLFLSLSATAEETTIVVAYNANHSTVSSTVDIEAEYVGLEIALSSSADTPTQRLSLIKKLIEAISLAATKDLSFAFQMGDVSPVPVDMSTSVPATTLSNYYIFTYLKPTEDIYTATQEIHTFLDQINKPAKTSITIGETGLAVSNPEKYRDQLLHTIKKEVDKTKEVLGTKSVVTVTGLENPVYVRRKDDKKVSLFLDYKISLGL